MKVNQKRMLLKPWHFLFPFHSESLIKIKPVPGQPSLPACRRPAGPARAPRSPAAGPRPCPEGAAVLPRHWVGTGSPPLPTASPEAAAAAARAARCFPRPRILQRDPRLSSQPMHGPASPGWEFRVEDIKSAPLEAASQQRARGVEGETPAPQAAAELRTESKPGGPAPSLSARSALGAVAPLSPTAAGWASGATHLPQPAAPPGAKLRRRPRHLHGDIRSTAGALSGAGARRRPACCGGLGGGWELWPRRSRGPGIDRRLTPAASRLRPRRGSARV